jgi:hypothetical protein
MATIRRRNGNWQVQVRLGGRQLSRTFPKKRDAEAWGRQAEAAIGAPARADAVAPAPTIGDLLERYGRKLTPGILIRDQRRSEASPCGGTPGNPDAETPFGRESL